MYIKPKAGAKSLWEIDEMIAMEALLYTKSDDVPMPWDADIEIDGDKVTIVGSIFGGGSNDYKSAGYCQCKISVAKFSQAYRLEIPEDVMSDEAMNALEAGGWEKA